jgi:hypothetical protein
MNVEIGTEAAQCPEKEYISGNFLAVWGRENGLPFFYSVIYWSMLSIATTYLYTVYRI